MLTNDERIIAATRGAEIARSGAADDAVAQCFISAQVVQPGASEQLEWQRVCLQEVDRELARQVREGTKASVIFGAVALVGVGIWWWRSRK